MKRILRVLAALAALLLMLSLCGVAAAEIVVNAAEHPVEKDGWYDAMEEVAVYLTIYERLPGNYLTKKSAQALGWQTTRATLGELAKGKSIGGDRFGNYDGLLPDAAGRKWTECDIDFDGNRRNAKRIVFSNDGLIYYTDDHYASFEEVVVEMEEPLPDLSHVRVEYGECYTAHEEVAVYLHTFGELPINYILKSDAQSLGYSAKKDNMGEVAPEFAIGGDTFGNKEGILPAAKGRVWRECDVDMKANGKRGNSRLIYSNDGLIYYTKDKYKSFTKLFDGE